MNAPAAKVCEIPPRGQTPTRTEDAMPIDRVMIVGSDDEMLHACRSMIQSCRIRHSDGVGASAGVAAVGVHSVRAEFLNELNWQNEN